MIELHHFDGYIGLLSALNLGYAGFEKFRSIIDDEVLQINENLTPEIQKVLERLSAAQTVISFEAGKNPTSPAAVSQKILTERLNQITKIKDDSQKQLAFPTGFQSLFLFSTFYCLCVMILGGYQSDLNEVKFYNCLFLLHFSFGFSLFIFIRSFTKWKGKALNLVLAFLIWCLFLSLVLLCTKNTQSEVASLSMRVNILICLFLIASPYVLHFIRLYVHKSHLRIRLYLCNRKCNKALHEIDNLFSNIKKHLDS